MMALYIRDGVSVVTAAQASTAGVVCILPICGRPGDAWKDVHRVAGRQDLSADEAELNRRTPCSLNVSCATCWSVDKNTSAEGDH